MRLFWRARRSRHIVYTDLHATTTHKNWWKTYFGNCISFWRRRIDSLCVNYEFERFNDFGSSLFSPYDYLMYVGTCCPGCTVFTEWLHGPEVRELEYGAKRIPSGCISSVQTPFAKLPMKSQPSRLSECLESRDKFSILEWGGTSKQIKSLKGYFISFITYSRQYIKCFLKVTEMPNIVSRKTRHWRIIFDLT